MASGHRLGEIDRPTLLLCGSEHHGASPENTRQMHGAIRGSRFVEIRRPVTSRIRAAGCLQRGSRRVLSDVDRGASLPAL
jgi:hypothetical protein